MRKRYYAVWTAVLTVIVGALAVIAGFTNGQYIMFTVFAALLLALTALLFFAPTSKSLAKEQWLFRVQIDIEEGVLKFTQYAGGREIAKKRELARVRKVVKDDRCYMLYVPNAGSLVICQNNLLKKGTFTELEALFAGKLYKEKEPKEGKDKKEREMKEEK